MEKLGSDLHVVVASGGHRLAGGVGDDVTFANRFLHHLGVREFSAATVRAYAYDLLNFLRFLTLCGAKLVDVVPTDLFDYLEWQSNPAKGRGGVVVRLDRQRGAAPATMNRRIAAVRGLFEYAVMAGLCTVSPVPAARRSSGLRAVRRGMLGHVRSGRSPGGGQLVRTQRRLPESLEPREVAAFTAGLVSCRDRAMVLLMLLGGLRAGEVRGLRLANIDMGLRRVRVLGKGGRERVVPVDPAFFTELAAYLRTERPKGCPTSECFVVLRGHTTGQAMTEAGLRRVFRTNRGNPGAGRVRPHRLRHTYGTGLADAGIDLLVLRDLMGHVSPETTAGYVHLSAASLAREYTAARAVMTP